MGGVGGGVVGGGGGFDCRLDTPDPPDPTQLLSELTIWAKYARHRDDLDRRETWAEIVHRTREMHVRRFPQFEEAIGQAFAYVDAKMVLPSMRSCQFAGRAIELNESRGYNCAYVALDDPKAFAEIMFLLLGGTGVGYSVQRQHVAELPAVRAPRGTRRYLVGDSLLGWADAVKHLVKAHLQGAPYPDFDFRDIRAQGTPLKTAGGKAPGHAPLQAALTAMDGVFKRIGVGGKLRPLDAHDIVCHLSEAVLAGGIRRSALIALFSPDDHQMLTCKQGEWWKTNPQRARANNSVVLVRDETHGRDFEEVFWHLQHSGSGEPGIYWTNDPEYGTNPCAEISLRSQEFCNLCEVNVSNVRDQADLDARVRMAAFIGTLQASYTDFHYLRPSWREHCEQDALLGVSMTGIASGRVLGLDLTRAALVACEENARVARRLGIAPAARVTTVKPSGTSSLVLGSSSGIHAWHAPHYLRRIRLGKNEPLYDFLTRRLPSAVEDDVMNPTHQAVVAIPVQAPEGAIVRDQERALDLLERVRRFNVEWIRPGHREGPNAHNVSATVSVKDKEWVEVREWMWQHRHDYNGLSLLPWDGGTHVQAPFEAIEQGEYERRLASLHAVDFARLHESSDGTDFGAEPACSGGVCDLKSA